MSVRTDIAHYRNQLRERFLRYVRIDTQSDAQSMAAPSSECQWNLLRLLRDELFELGWKEVELLEFGHLVLTCPPTSSHAESPRLAFFAHVDTALECSGKDVQPICHPNYSGERIVLPAAPEISLDPAELTHLATKRGHEIVTASGTTLLGADNKAGIAILMTLAEYLRDHPELPRGQIQICFTPDEEIGRGVERLPLEKIQADFAYTVDGEKPGDLQWETFSAKKATLRVTGVSIHPGWAFEKLVNAVKVGTEVVAQVSATMQAPEHSSGREGFIHPISFQGNSAEVVIEFILRDFDDAALEEKEKMLERIVREVGEREPRAQLLLEVKEQYRNMGAKLREDMRAVEIARRATRRLGFEPDETPIRGGTDGSVLTARGLRTPNIGSAAYAVHGPREWTSVEDMLKAFEVVTEIISESLRSLG